MKHAILRWSMYFVAILIVGPLAAALVAPLRTADGGADATPLVSTTPLLGLLAALAALAIAAATGIATARIASSVRGGMIAAGLVLVWVAFGTAEADDLVRTARSAAPLWLLTVEGALIGIAGILAATLLVLLGGGAATGDDPQREIHDQHSRAGQATGRPSSGPLGALGRFAGEPMPLLLAVLAGMLAGGAAAFFIATSPLKGQAIGAAIIAGVAAALAGRLTYHQVSLPALMLPMALLAILSPALGAIVAGGGEAVVEATYRGALFPTGYILPLDWMAGAFVGIPLGAAWAGSMIDKQTAATADART